GLALIETTRCADARFEFCESTRDKLLFQRSIHCFRVPGRAGSFRALLRATIDADKQIALALQRTESRIRDAVRQKRKSEFIASRGRRPSDHNKVSRSNFYDLAAAMQKSDFSPITNRCAPRSRRR